ncbi:MAG: peptide chain release factor 3 [Pseudomonadota bacterium]|nr:peptide chain release factor 3 [Pseudomonadota bacterium]
MDTLPPDASHADASAASTLATEAARRRTFAIISHPDAGKTTLTEKLLLYGGAIHMAGAVKSRKASRHAVSDWMAMEKERGISITSSVLQFDYRGKRLNLLDTPGHADFSEDTYRVLAAVDCAVMLIDNAKGVEERTRKLFDVCRLRGIPVLTLINKCDREGIEPLQLLDDVGAALGIQCAAVNWPVGSGKEFVGVAERSTGDVLRFSGGNRGVDLVEQERIRPEDLPEKLGTQLIEELDLLNGAGETYDREKFLAGKQTPVFFGSAMTNFGVQPFLEAMVDMAPGPRPRACTGTPRQPEDDSFTGFIFKIQANMNPRHRDRVAFLRVQSGRFVRGMDVKLQRTGDTVRLSKPHSFLAQERVLVEEAWPGDVVGLFDPGQLRIGDTLYVGEPIAYEGIPRFAPEHFGRVKLKDPLKRKHLVAGLTQLSQEGAIQLFIRPDIGEQDPYLGAVGQLQFEVLLSRLETEYNVKAVLDPSPYRFARWIGGDPKGLAWMLARRDYNVVEDRHGRPVVLSESVWPLQYAQRENPGMVLYEVEPL